MADEEATKKNGLEQKHQPKTKTAQVIRWFQT